MLALRRRSDVHIEQICFFCIHSFIRNLTLFTEDPDSDYSNQDVVWKRFEQAFLVAYGLVTHAPVFKDYLYEGFRQFYMDNIMYVEIRALLPLVCVFILPSQPFRKERLMKQFNFGVTQTYELDGRKNSRDWSMRACQEVLQRFTAQYPDFLGARFIFTVHRLVFNTAYFCVYDRILEIFKC